MTDTTSCNGAAGGLVAREARKPSQSRGFATIGLSHVAMTALLGTCSAGDPIGLVARRPFRMVDDDHLDRSLGRFQPQPELFL
jgi:hypothetical protein